MDSKRLKETLLNNYNERIKSAEEDNLIKN
jgi:hypothetical protein